MQDIDALLDGAEPPEYTKPVCLNHALRREWEEKASELQRLDRLANEEGARARAMMVDGARLRRLAQEVTDLERRMKESSIELTLRALPPGRYRAMIRECPPRKGDPIDTKAGFNLDAFFPRLIRESTARPTLTGQQWERLLGKRDDNGELVVDDEGNPVQPGVLSDGQFRDLGETCVALNQVALDVPFSAAAWRLTQISATS